MRDVFAGIVAVFLLLVAASLATTLKAYRKRRQRARDLEETLGRTIIAELPTSTDLVLVTEDRGCFYYGDRAIDKGAIAAVRVLINGAPIAAYVSRRHQSATPLQATSFEDRPEGIARDRWDVAVECVAVPGTGRSGHPGSQSGDRVLIECGAIRERVSQELARAIFDAIRDDIERRDRDPREGV